MVKSQNVEEIRNQIDNSFKSVIRDGKVCILRKDDEGNLLYRNSEEEKVFYGKKK